MEIFKTKLDSSPEMIFDVKISGTSESVTEVRLSVYAGEQKISYLGKFRGEKVSFKLEELQKYFSAGVFKYDLEIYIDNQYFVPLSGQIEFSEPIKVVAEFEKPQLVKCELNVKSVKPQMEKVGREEETLRKKLKQIGRQLEGKKPFRFIVLEKR